MTAKTSFLHLFEKLEHFVERLPGSLQKPILHEIVPLKDIFLRQRAPRIVITGDTSASSASLFNAIFSAPVAPFAQTSAVDAIPPAAGWQDFSHQGRGVLRLLDARASAPNASLAEATRAALSQEPPDLILFLQDSASAVGEDEAQPPADLERVESILSVAANAHESEPSVQGLILDSGEGEADAERMEKSRLRLQTLLATRSRIARRMAPVLGVKTFMRFRMDGTFDPESDRRRHVHELVRALLAELPNEARLEMARLSGAREAQAQLAQTLIKSFSAISGALGAQPIPLADLPFLLTFQVATVAGVIYISGRELSAKLAAEFLGTMGLNLGMGLVLREGARAAVRAAGKLFLPGVGSAISGFVAASGTYALGRAASAYYIEGASLADARELFRLSQKPGRKMFGLLNHRTPSR